MGLAVLDGGLPVLGDRVGEVAGGPQVLLVLPASHHRRYGPFPRSL